MFVPKDIWITNTNFRDGQQSMDTYTEKDRNAVSKCLERGCKFSEVTSWIRANKKDLKLVKDLVSILKVSLNIVFHLEHHL